MESLKDHAIPIISSLIFLNVAGFGWIWRLITRTLEEHSKDIKTYSRLHFECQRTLPEKFASLKAVETIFNRLDNILEKITEIPHKYRTKEDANRDWQELKTTLAKLETQQKERHDQLWGKLDNQTKLMMQEKEFINNNLLKLSDRVSIIENHNNHGSIKE